MAFLLEADLPGVNLKTSASQWKTTIWCYAYSCLKQTHTHRRSARDEGALIGAFSPPPKTAQETVDATGIKAEFCDGVLRVTLLKVRDRGRSDIMGVNELAIPNRRSKREKKNL